jgi:hypothetical protein
LPAAHGDAIQEAQGEPRLEGLALFQHGVENALLRLDLEPLDDDLDGVAAEIAKEVVVLFEDDDADAGAPGAGRASCRPVRRLRCSMGCAAPCLG